MTEWIMVVITFVYVVATILICLFNYRSAKATREQVAEAKRQFEENNRAFITVNFEIIRSGIAVLHIKNHGNRIAKDVTIKIDPIFVQTIEDKPHREQLELLCDSSFTIGIGQSWYCSLCASPDLKKITKFPLIIDISYCDALCKYKETTEIKISEYFWSIIYDNPLEDIRKQIWSQTGSIDRINGTLNKDIETSKQIVNNIQVGLNKLYSILESKAKESNDA